MFAKLKNINWEDVFVRAVKTFVQAFAGAFTVDRLSLTANDYGMIKTTLAEMALAAVTAVICAVWNTLQGLALQMEEICDDKDEKTE